MNQTKTNFGSLLCLSQQLEKDLEEPEFFLRKRDNSFLENGKLAAIQSKRKSEKLKQVMAWLNLVISPDQRKLWNYSSSFNFFVGFLGLLLGAVTSAAVFYYDGQHPVNLAYPLIAFVGIPILTLLLNLLLFIPDFILLKIPILGNLSLGLRKLNPAQNVFNLCNKLFKLELSSSSAISPSTLKWFLLAGTQVFSIAFFIAALAFFMFQVIFTDLAFGWGSTLDLNPGKVHKSLKMISAPWAPFYPEAVPDLNTVEQTRFYRLSQPQSLTPHKFGSWWYFLTFCIFVYGLLPRLVLFVIAATKKDAEINKAHLRLPGLSQLLWRLQGQAPELEAAASAERKQLWSNSPSMEKVAIVKANLDPQGLVLCWYFEPTLSQLQALGLSQPSKSENYFVISPAAASEAEIHGAMLNTKANNIYLLVKSWETPLEETMDFIKDLCAALNSKQQLQVIPVDPSDTSALLPGREEQTQLWARKLKGLVDCPAVISSINKNG